MPAPVPASAGRFLAFVATFVSLRSESAGTRVFTIDLDDSFPDAWDANGHARALVLVRWRGRTLSAVELACEDGVVRAAAVRAAVAADGRARDGIAGAAVRRWLLGEDAEGRGAPMPSWSVVVCTRDHADDLRRCLEALMKMAVPPDAPPGEVLVVDHDPSDDGATRVAGESADGDGGRAGDDHPSRPRRPAVRYVRVERPGAGEARAAGARAARGEVVAYADDDVLVDADWLARLLEPFADARVAAVTGLSVPLDVGTMAEWLDTRYGNAAQGLARRVFDPERVAPADAALANAGAPAAFRRDLLVGLFDGAPDVGPEGRTGADAYALYRLLADGHHVVYTPDAIVSRRRCRDAATLASVLHGRSAGIAAFLTRCVVEHGDLRAARAAARWVWDEHLRGVVRVVARRRSALPPAVALAWWRGLAVGPWAYLRSRDAVHRRAREAAPAARGVAPDATPADPAP